MKISGSRQTQRNVRTYLIIHADDVGLSHSVNEATFRALQDGVVSSASAMVVCPWFTEAVNYARTRSDLDIGVHLTMTSEWRSYRWRPIAGRTVPTLVGPDGYFWPDADTFRRRARVDDVEREIRAQIEAAVAAGLRPTHCDSHMFALWRPMELRRVAQRVAASYGLPFLCCESGKVHATHSDGAEATIGNFRVWSVGPSTDAHDWDRAYRRIADLLSPGLNVLLVHLGDSEPELRAITGSSPHWGAAWRARDDRAIRCPEFRSLLRKRGVRLCGWRDIAAVADNAAPASGRRADRAGAGGNRGYRSPRHRRTRDR